MASMNPNLILAASQGIDVLGAMGRGNALAREQMDMQRQNALAGYYRTNADGLLSGDPNALAGLMGHDPQAALGIQRQRQEDAWRQDDRQYRRDRDARQDERAARQEERAAQQWQIQVEQYAAGLSEQERKAQAEEITRALAGAKHFYDTGNRAGYDAFLTQAGLDPADYSFDNFPALAGQYGEAAKILSGTDATSRVQSSDILDDGTVVTVMSDGTSRVVSPTGEVLTGQAAADAVRAARDYGVENQRAIYGGRRVGTLGADIELGGTAKAVETMGAETVKAGMSAWDDYGKLQTSLANIDEALSALDRGAQSGVIYKMLPNVTEASASLNNAMNRMGLDVIGSVTFGALSEGEMRLAMDTAVPRDLSPTDLKVWLTRKRDAQQKAAEMLADAAMYLTTPGNTINGWIERNKAAKQQQPAAQGGAVQPGAPDFSAMSDDDLAAWIAQNGG